MKLFKNVNIGTVVKGLTMFSAVIGVGGLILEKLLDSARQEEVKETARDAAREEVKKALASIQNEEA